MPPSEYVNDGAQRSAGDPGEAAFELVDARGLSCPMPVIELAKAVEATPIGGRVRLLATDPAARVDVPVWCRMQRQRLLAHHAEDAVLTFDIERVR